MAGVAGGEGEFVRGVGRGARGVDQVAKLGGGDWAGHGAFPNGRAHVVAARAEQGRAVGDDGDTLAARAQVTVPGVGVVAAQCVRQGLYAGWRLDQNSRCSRGVLVVVRVSGCRVLTVVGGFELGGPDIGFGACAVKVRFTRSGGRSAVASGRVVHTLRPRRTPRMPSSRISRAT